MMISWKGKASIALAVIFLLFFGASLSGVSAGEPVVAGDSYFMVVQKKGSPDHKVESGRDLLLFYGSSIIELMDNEVVRIDGRPAPRPETTASHAAAGQNPVSASRGAPSGPPPTAKRIIDVRQQGRAIDINPLLVAGGFTVVAFYADW